MTSTRSHRAPSRRAAHLNRALAALAVAALAAGLGSSCGSATRDGLFDPHAGAGGGGSAGAAGQGGSAGAAGATGGGGAGSSGASGASGAGSSGSSGSAGGGGSASGAGGGGGSAALPELDAGSDASSSDASAANRLGCGPAERADCDALAAGLTHRYGFAGTGSNVLDSVGTAHGSVINGQLSGNGSLVLSGAQSPENYVNLPNGIVSVLGSATFEAWVDWSGGAPWQRIFDFGSSPGPEDVRAGGDAYLFLTPRSDGDTVRAAFISSETVGEVQVDSTAPLPTGTLSHVAVVVDGQANTLALFVNGALTASAALPSSLAALATDDNNWLGRSEFPSDPGFAGTLTELRIYSTPLTAAQLALSFQLGPDAAVSR